MYRKAIERILKLIGRDYVDPRHVEAYMRLEHKTLDELSIAEFRHEVELASCCVQADGHVKAEELAKSYGL